MKVSEVITTLGRDFTKEFTITNEPLYSQYKKTYEYLNSDGKKGVIIIGSIGCGKSMMMRVMQRIFKDTQKRFKWVNSTELKDLLDECNVSDIKLIYGRTLKMDLYIDDIGVTANIFQYGNCINIISELILERYELFISEGYKTHFSSNIPMYADNKEIPTIENTYGHRIYDRIVEMCELISWNSKSMRK